MTTTWTLYDPTGNNITPTPPPTGTLSLTYDDQGCTHHAAGLVAHCECESDESTVTVYITRAARENTVDPEHTSVTKTPSTIPDAGWTSGSGDSVTLSFGNSATNGVSWCWHFHDPTITGIAAPIALNIKTTVKRPPTEGRRAAR
ncbi:MAG: hypothetical protein R3B09_21095 [Nannocystaceae bacterium]